jgi:hypothetical protein
MRLRRSALVPVLVIGISALALSGCAPERGGPLAGSPTPGTSVVGEPPAPSEAPDPVVGAAFTVDCTAIVSDDEIFQYNQNFAADTEWSPAADSLAAEVVAEGGTACAWVNLSGGDHIEIAVATPSADRLAAIKEAASSGTPTTGLGDEGYFSTDGEFGQLEIFRGPYWMTATSLYFGEGGEANQLVSTAISHLP